jgi:phage gp36-like protein
MAYSSLDDIKDVIPEGFIIQLTDDAGAGSIDTQKVSKAIADADEVIDGYLRGRYTLPLPAVPSLIRKLSVDLAVFNLYSRRPELAMPETVMVRYNSAIKMLEGIQKGVITLGAVDFEPVPEPGEYRVNKTDEDRIFSKEVLSRY